MGEVTTPAPGPEDYARMLELADLATPFAIRVATTIGLIDRLASGPASVDALADDLGVHRRSLHSVVAILAGRGLTDWRPGGVAELTTAGRTLLHPHARRAFDLASAEAHIDHAWRDLLHTVTTGEPSYAQVHGLPFWEHLAADTGLSASFDSYLADHAVWAVAVAQLPIWPSSGTVVDVGGGDGAALVTILEAHAALGGELVELESVVRRATQRFEDAGLADRATATAGSFFDELPAGREVYVLAHVLHDWPDAEATAILRRVADAGAQQVVIVERVVDADAPTFHDGWSDLRMRLLFGAGERTADDWTRLVGAVGFEIDAIHPWNEFGGAVIVLRP